MCVACMMKREMNGLGGVRPEMARHLGSKENGQNVLWGLSMGNPRTDVGLLKTVPICVLDRKCQCEFA